MRLLRLSVSAFMLAATMEAWSDMAIKLEGTQTGQGFPALLVHLERDGESQGRLRVRFPEGIDATRADDGRHLKFYQDIRSPAWPAKLECEPEALPVEWTGDEADTGYVMRLNNGMALTARATVEGAKVVMAYELENGTDIDMASCIIWSCVLLQPAPPIADNPMERTGVLSGGAFKLFRELIPHFEPFPRDQAEYQRFAGYVEGMIPQHDNPNIVPHPGFPDDRTKDNYFWRSPEPIDLGAIGTVSADGEWSVATVGEGVHSVWTNPGISCQHADPAGRPLKPGGTLTVTNAIHTVEGGRDGLEAYLKGLTEE